MPIMTCQGQEESWGDIIWEDILGMHMNNQFYWSVSQCEIEKSRQKQYS